MRLVLDIRIGKGTKRHPLVTVACTAVLAVGLTLAVQGVTGHGGGTGQVARSPVSASDGGWADRVDRDQHLVERLKGDLSTLMEARRSLASPNAESTISQLTDRINAMQFAVVEGLRLGTGQLTSTLRDTTGDGPVATDAEPRMTGRGQP